MSTQSGSSIHSPTSWRRGTRRHLTGVEPATAGRVDHGPIVVGPVALKARRAAPRDRRIQAARSRTSTNCTGRHAGPGTRTSPPRATRCGQYVKRPVGSCGPTISPGARPASTGPGTPLSTASLAERLERAVVRAATSSEPGSVSSASGELLVDDRRRTTRTRRCSRRRRSGRPRPRAARRSAPTTRGQVARGVDDGVPLASASAVEAAVAVADEPLELRDRAPAFVLPRLNSVTSWPRCERRVDHRAPEELRAAEEEEPHSELRDPGEQPVDLLGRVVVDDPGAHGAVDLVEAEPPDRLERVVVAPPDRDVALGEVLGDGLRACGPATLKQNVGTRPSIVGRPWSVDAVRGARRGSARRARARAP